MLTARLKAYGFRGALIFTGTRLAVTSALMYMISVHTFDAQINSMVLGAILAHWLGQVESDTGTRIASSPGPVPPPPTPKQREETHA